MTACPVCGAPFELPSRPRGCVKVYCSKTCRYKHSHDIDKERRRAARAAKIIPPVPCCLCGGLFKPRSDMHKYCSEKCRRHVEHTRDYYRTYKLRRKAARQNAAPSLVLTSD